MWKCKPFRWLWGLPFLALLWLLVFIGERKNIEADLRERVSTTLEDSSLGWARAEFEGRDGVLTGTAGERRDIENAAHLARETYGVRVVDERADMLRRVSPFTWSAEKAGGKLVLNGFVPNREDRGSVLTMARSQFPELQIEDNMVVASGAPDRRTFIESAGFGLKQLTGFQFGRVALSDKEFSIEGLTRDVDTFGAVNNALVDDMPSSVSLASNRVRAPEKVAPLASPFDWSVRKHDNRIVLGGYISSEEDRDEVLAMARRRFPDMEVFDRMSVARGAPERQAFLDTIEFSFRQLADFEYGRASLRDAEFSIEGRTKDRDTYEEFSRSIARDLPKGVSVASNEVTAPAAKIPFASPYEWSVNMEDGLVVLGGYVHSEEDRRKVLELARRQFPGMRLQDRMTLATGSVDRDAYMQAIEFSFRQLSTFESGRVGLSDAKLSIEGRTKDREAFDDFDRAIKRDLPDGITVASNKVTAPAPKIPRVSTYEWSVDKDDNRIVLGGYAPSEADRQKVLAMARRRFPGMQVEDRMSLATGDVDSETYIETVDFSFRQLSSFDYGRAGLRNDRYSIEGRTRSRDDYSDVARALQNDLPRGMRLAGNEVSQPEPKIPMQSPYTWSAHKEGRELVLSGYVHSEQERADMIARARRAMPDVEVKDQLEVARGEPTGAQWREASDYAFRQLAQLDRGTASLRNMDYKIEGKTDDSNAYASLDNALSRPPKGFRVAERKLSVPKVDPYTWRADYHSGQLTLSGYMPDERSRQALRAETSERFAGAQVTDEMRVGFGAPDGWAAAAGTSLRELSRLENGSASLWDTELELRGRARDEGRRDDVRAKLKRDLGRDFVFFDKITVPAPVEASREVTEFAKPPRTIELVEEDYKSNLRLERDTCEVYMNSLLADQTILFGIASAKLTPESFPVLTRLAHTANRCPDTRIEIAGHTDADGSKRFNEFLSLRRARSVVKYLTEQGVLADRLSAVGFGETRPLAPNNSRENKAKNRRIEFSVKEF